MRCGTGFGHYTSLLIRGAVVFVVCTILVAFGYSHAEAANIVVSGGCSLVDAITSANTDSAIESCSTGSGADTIVLSGTTTTFAVADNNFGGENNALPPITSTVTISGNGATILRDLSLGCPAVAVTQTFRLLYVDSTGDLTLNGVTLQNGCAQQGGAIHNNGGHLALVYTNLMSNGATLDGGIFAPSGFVTITQSLFMSNTASNDGGALYFGQGRVEGSDFIGNSAGAEGGAFLLTGGNDKYLLSNSIMKNRAGEDGAAIYLLSGVAHFDNNLVAGNAVTSPEGEADIALGAASNPSTLYGYHNTVVAGASPTAIVTGRDVQGDSVFVTDTIFSGYASALVGSFSEIIVNGVLWDNVTVPTTTVEGEIIVTNVYSGSAAFVAPDANNFHLTLGSLAVNHAVSNLPATDFDGDVRPQGGISDLGFDEFVPSPSIEVSKTVGTDANRCGTSDLLTVDSNTPVYYCLTLRNSGDITLTQHSVADAVLGVQSGLAFDLAPAATLQITRSRISALGQFTVSASITNTVFITSSTVSATPTDTVRAAQFAVSAAATDTAVVRTSAPTELPETEQPEIGDDRLYLPALH